MSQQQPHHPNEGKGNPFSVWANDQGLPQAVPSPYEDPSSLLSTIPFVHYTPTARGESRSVVRLTRPPSFRPPISHLPSPTARLFFALSPSFHLVLTNRSHRTLRTPHRLVHPSALRGRCLPSAHAGLSGAREPPDGPRLAGAGRRSSAHHRCSPERRELRQSVSPQISRHLNSDQRD